MLSEALTALAMSGGTAVMTAAGTEAWEGFRHRVAAWFGRGNTQRESAELERLGRTAAELEAADGGQLERLRIRQEASWQARFEAFLEDLPEDERERAGEALRELLAESAAQAQVSAGDGGMAVGGNVHISAQEGSVAAGVIHGGVQIGHPQVPDPPKG
ncbi:hypothetical protein EH183_41300 [Streptomyces sp. CB01881]|uniref:hypothetical protein n=1 Tax=Streptomyces sp. CB01881 TaxID=2078691 RepID=UPI0011DF7B3D|nr:hypothetical protein [Streptomyces sp. CB01881]TYC66651.1 hypothetical protein EH183_41300 [Streptomyces sp. CB01881]